MLLFVGGKMVAAGVLKVPIVLALAVIAVLLGGSVAASILFPRREP